MSTLDGLATALQATVGEKHVHTGHAAAPYAVDDVSPAMVVFPGDDDQVAAVMRLAAEHQATVFPRGGGSHLTLGHPPKRVDVVLCLRRLQQHLAYEPADMTTTVQAGVCLEALQQTLGTQRQFLALDPPATATTTLGGIVATNSSGPRRLAYGSARDLLLGIAVITVDGRRTKAGARVVKNVTGYDLNKLYIGSLGTLAVIVELTFRLHPLPPAEHTLGIGFSQPAQVAAGLKTVRQLPLRINSLELLNASAATWLSENASLPAIDTPYLLIARLEGTPEVAEKQAARLLQAVQQPSAGETVVVQSWSIEEQARLWHTLEASPMTIHATAPEGVVAKVSLRLADVPAFCEDMQRVSDSGWPVLAHAAHGLVYVHIPPEMGVTPDAANMLDHIRTLDACVARLHGRRVIEQAPVEVKRHCDVWGPPGDDFVLMRALKASFDPHNRLNPGRFIGGL